jgi:hypothetical protein
VAGGIAQAPTIKIMVVSPRALATGIGIAPIIEILGVPVGVILGRTFIYDRISGRMVIEDRLQARTEVVA